jgi:hypothetical protein
MKNDITDDMAEFSDEPTIQEKLVRKNFISMTRPIS